MSERAPAWKTALYAAACLGMLLGFFFNWADGSFPPADASQAAKIVLAMVAWGAGFAAITGYFLRSDIVPAVEDLPLEPGERLIHTGFANHVLNFESRGGRLAITDKRLIFVPHSVNIQRSQLSLPRSQIADMRQAAVADNWRVS